ncbi:MAG: desulfoferrodoxin [Clostridia bacterium]|nr:desulfoferrodoxin [Clostridia bacterium]MBO7245307.1 desulfoferrodoxin [Clostridia bacterium]MBO7737884.1 desulfoferrodoxin [Clostridia bacterium]
MCNETRFYICEHCGNIVGMIKNSGVPVVCCGQKMTLIEAGTVEASREKHIPAVNVEGNTVKVCVGSVEHPMTEEHSITWVYLQTDKGGQRKCLNPGEKPEVTFAVADEKPVAVYAYCNLHGLWKADVE